MSPNRISEGLQSRIAGRGGSIWTLQCKLCTKRLRTREDEGQRGREARFQLSWGEDCEKAAVRTLVAVSGGGHRWRTPSKVVTEARWPGELALEAELEHTRLRALRL